MLCACFRTDDQIDGPEGLSLQFGGVLLDIGAPPHALVAIQIAMNRIGAAGLFQPLPEILAGPMQTHAKIPFADAEHISNAFTRFADQAQVNVIRLSRFGGRLR